MKTTVLLVPGFVADTYSEIEQSYVELSTHTTRDFQFLWLVPDISSRYIPFAKEENRRKLSEPVYVTYLKRNHIPYHVGNISKYNIIANFLLFRRLFIEHAIDTVYTNFGFERFWAAFFGKLWGKKTIWNEHWHSLGTRFVFPKRVFYMLFVDEFIAVSRFITNTLPANRKVHTVLNAIRSDGRRYLSDTELSSLRNKLGLGEIAKCILMVAAFRTEKRHELALELCRIILAQRDDVLFVFLGEGPLRHGFLERIRDLNLQKKILVPGHVDNVNDYYAVAHISILTSYYEPFGYCVLESMKYGVPVVAFNNGGPAEIIRHDETGVLVEEGDISGFAHAINDLIHAEEKRHSMGENAVQEVALKFNREIWAQQIISVLHGASRTEGVRNQGKR
jgi:L-malate glycosyltransferase